MFEIIQKQLNRKFVYCDVGARGGLAKRWKPYRKIIKTVSFEPDEKALVEDACFNTVLYSRNGEIPLHLTQSPGCSSILEPNFELLEQFPESGRYKIEKTETMKCATLDTLHEKNLIPDIDFIKLDAQGAEREILKGGQALLEKCIVGLEIEIAFLPVYKDQPLFKDIDAFIGDHFHLQIQDLRKTFWKRKKTEHLGPARGQLALGDALYFRTIETLPEWCSQQNPKIAFEKLTCAILMGLIYGTPGYSMSILEHPKLNSYFSSEAKAILKKVVSKNGRGVNQLLNKIPKMAGLFLSLYRLFEKTHHGWGAGEAPLGYQKKCGWFQ